MASAGAVITDAQGRILIVKPTYKEGWNLPGGRIEPGETPSDACQREIHEELGLHLNVGRLLVDAKLLTPAGEHVYYVFDAGWLTDEQKAAIRVQESEIEQHQFSAPEDIGPDQIPPAARPMWEATLKALSGTEPEVLERTVQP